MEIKASQRRENFLSKGRDYRVVHSLPPAEFLRFVTYLGKKLLQSDVGSMGCGILRVEFLHESKERTFTIDLRRSAALTVFFQIDQFHLHL